MKNGFDTKGRVALRSLLNFVNVAPDFALLFCVRVVRIVADAFFRSHCARCLIGLLFRYPMVFKMESSLRLSNDILSAII